MQVSVVFDVPVNGALLQVGDRPPVPMSGDLAKSTFAGTFTATEDAAVAVLATDGSGQVIAKLPEQAWTVHCTKDAAPTIEMHWPTTDATVAPAAAMKVTATLRDDYGVTSSRVLMAVGPDAPLTPVATAAYAAGTTAVDLSQVLELKPDVRKHGNSVRVQVEATDDRDLSGTGYQPAGSETDHGLAAHATSDGPQTTLSPIYTIQLRDPEVAAREAAEQADQLRAILMAMLKSQRTLNTAAVAWHAGDAGKMASIGKGQADLRDKMKGTADTFAFDDGNRVVQKALLVLALNPAADAVDTAATLAREKDNARQATLGSQLQADQRRIASTLESLLALLSPSPEATTQPTTRPGDQLANREQLNKLDEQLKAYMKEQQRLLDQTASLAKKPVDNWDDKDRKLAAHLQQAQDKLDAFMKSVLSDFSKLAEQDMANASMAKEAQAIYSEVTMAAGALKQQAVEIAVPAEENGLESAKELSSNLERWLSNTPDRQQWTQEEMPNHSDTPMPELPTELQDMVGQLIEQQEDLFDQVEDMNANITDSADKGIGWDRRRRPHRRHERPKASPATCCRTTTRWAAAAVRAVAGVSQGEFVGDSAVGKGGRNTPTRLDPTAFQKGPDQRHEQRPRGRRDRRRQGQRLRPGGPAGPGARPHRRGHEAARHQTGRASQHRRAAEPAVRPGPLRQLPPAPGHPAHARRRDGPERQSVSERPAPPRRVGRRSGRQPDAARRAGRRAAGHDADDRHEAAEGPERRHERCTPAGVERPAEGVLQEAGGGVRAPGQVPKGS